MDEALAGLDATLLAEEVRDELEAIQFVLLENEFVSLLPAIKNVCNLIIALDVPEWPHNELSDVVPSLRVTFGIGAEYPDIIPPHLTIVISNDCLSEFAEAFQLKLNETANELIGSPMIICMIEALREALEDEREKIIATVKTASSSLWDNRVVKNEDMNQPDEDDVSVNAEKEQKSLAEVNRQKLKGMSKTQKRNMWKNMTGDGKRERGYNWVDLVSHLSKAAPEAT